MCGITGFYSKESEGLDQDELIDLMKQNKFSKCQYINLNGGIVALHSAWKL